VGPQHRSIWTADHGRLDLLRPEAVAIADDKLYIADTGDSTVVEIPAGCDALQSCMPQKTVADQSNNDLSNPNGLAVAGNKTCISPNRTAIK
jgi:hypothetical protein